MARLLIFNALISSEHAAHCPDFIDKGTWPPNSPDLNPLDYHVWGLGLGVGQIQPAEPTTEEYPGAEDSASGEKG